MNEPNSTIIASLHPTMQLDLRTLEAADPIATPSPHTSTSTSTSTNMSTNTVRLPATELDAWAPPCPVPARASALRVPRPGAKKIAGKTRSVNMRLAATFALAVVLVCGIASYFGVQLVFATNRTWIAPTLLSKSDERVVAVASAHQQEMARVGELELHQSELEARLARVKAGKTRELEAQLETAIADTRQLLRHKDALLDAIEASPYWLATRGDVVLAFVPYENLAAAKKGAPIHGCRTSLALCEPVGTIEGVLAGEVSGTHPFRGYPVRGQLVRLSLMAPRFAERPVLFVGQAPLGF